MPRELKQDTIADICQKIRDAGIPDLADHIEAAWKRERAEIEAQALSIGGIVESSRHKQKPQGNAAAMRDALEFTAHMNDSPYTTYDVLVAVQKARAALTAPARNCDVMSRSMCTTHFSTTYEGNSDGLCDVQTEREKNIHLYYKELIDWLFAPAAERKGEGDGR